MLKEEEGKCLLLIKTRKEENIFLTFERVFFHWCMTSLFSTKQKPENLKNIFVKVIFCEMNGA